MKIQTRKAPMPPNIAPIVKNKSGKGVMDENWMALVQFVDIYNNIMYVW